MNKMVTCQPQEKKKNTTVQFIQVFQLNYLYGTNNHDFLTQKKKKKKNHDFVIEISVFTCTSKGVGVLVCLCGLFLLLCSIINNQAFFIFTKKELQ